jgi:hypothetical protein
MDNKLVAKPTFEAKPGVDTPLLLPSAGAHEAIGLKQVPGRCHQQHHGGVGDSRCVRVGAIGFPGASEKFCTLGPSSW